MSSDRKIKFHDGDSEDPDWKLKQVVLIIVEGLLVAGKGIEQCWITGKLESGLAAGDFGKHIDVNEFRCLLAAPPHMWTDMVN